MVAEHLRKKLIKNCYVRKNFIKIAGKDLVVLVVLLYFLPLSIFESCYNFEAIKINLKLSESWKLILGEEKTFSDFEKWIFAWWERPEEEKTKLK